jgi:hypothetical protein
MNTAEHGGIIAHWTDIIVKKTDGVWWELHDDLFVDLILPWCPGIYRIKIDKGWMTDLGSVPQWARSLVNEGSSDDDLMLAYLVHDAWYQYHISNDRKEADRVLRCMSEDCKGVNVGVPTIIYWGVRLGGQEAWDEFDEHPDRQANRCHIKLMDR